MSGKDKDIKECLYFVGGSPCCGKSTVCAALAERYNLQYYKVDDHESRHLSQSNPIDHPTMHRLTKMSWNEMWMRPVDLQVKEELDFYRERFDMILADLRVLAGDRPIIAENSAFLPELLDSLGVSRAKAFFMVPSKNFQVEHYMQRGFVRGILAECRDPRQAFANWMERDYRFGQVVAAQAEQLGYRTFAVDGSLSIEQTVRILARHFRLE